MEEADPDKGRGEVDEDGNDIDPDAEVGEDAEKEKEEAPPAEPVADLTVTEALKAALQNVLAEKDFILTSKNVEAMKKSNFEFLKSELWNSI